MKSIMITGAGSGIGKATAQHFAGQGWFVGLGDINGEAVRALADEIGPDHCCWARMDVTDGRSVDSAMELFGQATGGKMDVLFNNAGIMSVGFFDELTLEEQLATVEVNLSGVIRCTHRAIPLLAAGDAPRIVNMASGSVFYGTAHIAVYSATKAALSSLTESLNMELERKGIHVCDIRVPFVQTPLLETPTKAASLEKMGVQMSPGDVAAMVHKSLGSRKVHYNHPGVYPLIGLQRLAPTRLQRFILKHFMMPR